MLQGMDGLARQRFCALHVLRCECCSVQLGEALQNSAEYSDWYAQYVVRGRAR